MENRQELIQSIWHDMQDVPRMKVNALLAQMGLSKSMYAKLPDQDAKKVLLGFVTRLDDETLQEVVPLLHA
ncbi:MAG: hypothetical protein WCC10_13135 [Tumebacillaceae bacterium]